MGSFEALANAAMQKALTYAPVMLPAKVAKWKPPGPAPLPGGGSANLGPRVDAEILIAYVRQIATPADLPPNATLRESGGRYEAISRYPIAYDVPYLCPGPRNFRLRKAPAPGDIGALVISTRSILRWRQGDGEGLDPLRGIGAPDLSSSIFIPGLEIGDDPHTWDTSSHLGPPKTPNSTHDLSCTPSGAWEISGPSLTVKSPSTSIGPLGTGVALAKNAQHLAIWDALGIAINALPPGPVTDVALKGIFGALDIAITAAIGTTSLVAQ